MTSVIEVKDKWLLSVPDEMQVPAECLASARRGRAADLRVIFTQFWDVVLFFVLCQKDPKAFSAAWIQLFIGQNFQ